MTNGYYIILDNHGHDNFTTFMATPWNEGEGKLTTRTSEAHIFRTREEAEETAKHLHNADISESLAAHH